MVALLALTPVPGAFVLVRLLNRLENNLIYQEREAGIPASLFFCYLLPNFMLAENTPLVKKWSEAMGNEEVRFLPYDEAARIVAAIQEEEDIHRSNRRVLTVYNQADKEICWFDFDEVVRDLGAVEKGEEKQAVSEYILHRIPEWVLEI